MAKEVYVAKVFTEGAEEHCTITRNFKVLAGAEDWFQRTVRVYEMKSNRDRVSYRVTVHLQDKEGIKGAHILSMLYDRRIEPVR